MAAHDARARQVHEWLYITDEPDDARLPAEGGRYVASPTPADLEDWR